MQVLETVQETTELCQRVRRPLGLVPTMGALHQGHLALVRRARQENATVIASIFVNPTQFLPHEDYATYPWNRERDLATLEEEGVDVAFVPSVEEMYPPGFDTYVEVGHLSQPLEGKERPGHFRGVATVVAKLFLTTRPNRAYFGQKDGQQALVVKRMNADLKLGVEVVVVPTMREEDGLAFSSRNASLTPQERRAAPVLYRALCHAQELWKKGERDAGRLRQEMNHTLAQEPLARVEYVSVADQETLEELDQVDRPAMVSVAVRFPSARLIDNLLLQEE